MRRAPWCLLAVVLATACGAKTGLKIPDSGPDAERCVPGTFALAPRGAEVLFVIDRSGSMELTLDGRDLEPGLVSRWTLLVEALRRTLTGSDDAMEIGAKLFPQHIPPTEDVTHANGCVVSPGIELEPGPGQARRLVALLSEVTPRGGTPTFEALAEARGYLLSHAPPPGVARVMILATDGGPNCNPDTGVDPSVCVCTTERDDCALSPAGPYNCIDDLRTLGLLDDIHRGDGIPTYVVGIDNPARPELVDVLERMAVAGGRPREVPGEASFYSVRSPADLEGALATIRDLIADCVFAIDPVPPEEARITVRVGGAGVGRDASRTDGWDWTSRGELSLFGGACGHASEGGGVEVSIECDAAD